MDTTHDRDDVTRRTFLKAAGAGAAASALAGVRAGADDKLDWPRKALGRTGVKVPPIGLGTAPAGHRPEKEAVAFFNECLDLGLNYLDAAPKFAGYGDAQVYLGRVLKERRDEAFVVTKCFEPDGEKALALLKKNLAELQIERADLVYAHSIGSDEMAPEKIYAKDGVCKALEKARRDGLTRFLGVSGHNRPDRFLKALQEWDFDVMMNAVSLVARHIYNFEGQVWPVAARKGVGLAAMKVFGGAPGGDQKPKGARMPDDLRHAAVRYALNLPGVHVVVIGIHDREELGQIRGWLAENRKALDADERQRLEGPTRKLAEAWGPVYGPVA